MTHLDDQKHSDSEACLTSQNIFLWKLCINALGVLGAQVVGPVRFQRSLTPTISGHEESSKGDAQRAKTVSNIGHALYPVEGCISNCPACFQREGMQQNPATSAG